MTDVYSLLLLFSLMSTSVAAGLFLFVGRKKPGSPIVRVARILPLMAILFVVLAGLLHYRVDHSRSSPNPMEPMSFFLEHKAVVILFAGALVSIVLARQIHSPAR